MAEAPTTSDAVFRIYINADIQRVWHELTKTDEGQGAVFNAWLHTTGLVPGGRLQMRTGTGRHVIVDGEVVAFEPPHRFVHTHPLAAREDFNRTLSALGDVPWPTPRQQSSTSCATSRPAAARALPSCMRWWPPAA